MTNDVWAILSESSAMPPACTRLLNLVVHTYIHTYICTYILKHTYIQYIELAYTYIFTYINTYIKYEYVLTNIRVFIGGYNRSLAALDSCPEFYASTQQQASRYGNLTQHFLPSDFFMYVCIYVCIYVDEDERVD